MGAINDSIIASAKVEGIRHATSSCGGQAYAATLFGDGDYSDQLLTSPDTPTYLCSFRTRCGKGVQVTEGDRLNLPLSMKLLVEEWQLAVVQVTERDRLALPRPVGSVYHSRYFRAQVGGLDQSSDWLRLSVTSQREQRNMRAKNVTSQRYSGNN